MESHLQNQLLALARAVLENELLDSNHNVENYRYPVFNGRCGLFVTLMLDGNLRGCIGRTEPMDSIYKNVIGLAKSAAFDDLRFSPLTAKELKKIIIEISLLTVPEKIEGIDNHDKMDQIRPGIDGVILKAGHQESTFLPQVWKSISTTESFVSELCRKAGLSRDYWKDNEVELSVYQVEHFQETESPE